MSNIPISTSDIISIVAVVIAFLFGVGNLIYTRKTFEASTYPLLDISLSPHLNTISSADHFSHPHPFHDYRLSVKLKNLSSNTAIAETKYSITVANPFRAWRFWQKEWFLYDSGGGRTIAPLSTEIIESNGSIEVFLMENMPMLISKVEVQQWGEGRGKANYYSPRESRPLKLLLTVTYRPGVTGAGYRSISKSYKLLPNPQSYQGLPDKLFDWKTKEIG